MVAIARVPENTPAARSHAGQAALAIHPLFRWLLKHDGTNLHLRVEMPPVVRINGMLCKLDMDPLTDEQMVELCCPLMDERAKRNYEMEGGADFAHVFDVDGQLQRFRINLFRQQGHMGLVVQTIGQSIPDFATLNLPPVIERFCHYDQGMVLLAGMTGCGKSTTIASMLEWINHHSRKHILTIEDPIEFIYSKGTCLINQREVGTDVKDFEIAMTHAVREDPDVMLVGEMRDSNTFATAIHAAETGHLVFGTIHSASASATVGRILDMFPYDLHRALRSSLAFNMKAIIAQKLVPTVCADPPRVPIVEIMIFNPIIKSLILEEKDDRLPDAIRMGRDEGMQEFNDSLFDFEQRGLISRETALQASPNPEALKMKFKGLDVKASAILK